MSDTDPFLDTSTQLTPSHAVAAIIRMGGRYLLQLRDSKIGIFYPGHWGFFGGAIEPGEDDGLALKRELAEELSLDVDPDELRLFTTQTYDFGFAGLGVLKRAYFELDLPSDATDRLVLGEGREWRLFEGDEILSPHYRVTPYDSFAIWMHHHQRRIVL